MTLEERIAAAWAQADKQDHGVMLAGFQQLYAEDPADPIREFELASAYDWLGREAEAIGHYEAALAAGLPRDRERRAQIQLGSSLRNVGRVADAVTVLRTVAQDEPGNVAARCFLALALADDGHAREAVAELVDAATRTSADEGMDAYREALQRYAGQLTEGGRG